MYHWLGLALAAVAAIGTLTSTIYLGLAFVGVRRFRSIARKQQAFENTLAPADLPFVAVLKPLHGLEPQLEENLESFFVQDYPDFEVLFAVDFEDDEALDVARRVAARHPERRSTFVINGKVQWPNPTAWSLYHMADKTDASIFVTSDSDVIVDRNYLREVVTPLLETNTGMLTCIYRGWSTGGFWSVMEAMGMSVEMTAGVLIANWMEGMKFGVGPTVVVRRDALDSIGGYATTGQYWANDFATGNLIAANGYHVALAGHTISHVVPPLTLRGMWERELRWSSSNRRTRPMGHLGIGFIFAVPYGLLALVAGALLGHPLAGAAAFAWSILNRTIEAYGIGSRVVRDPDCRRRPWLYAVRDVLGFAIWVASFFYTKIKWRDRHFKLVDGKVLMNDSDGDIVAS